MLRDIYRKDTSLLYETPILQQTAFWSNVKKELGIASLAIELQPAKSLLSSNNSVWSDMLVILKPVSKYNSVAYVPYGPELEPEEEYQGIFLEELSERLRACLPKHCISIRYELSWESYWAKDEENYEDGKWKGEPECYAREFRFNFNTIHKNFWQAHGNSLPSSTIFINLEDNLQTIMNRMKPKTRYNIGLAHRKGVTVRTAGAESLDIWYRLYTESAHRNGFFLHDRKYFEKMLEVRADDTLSPVEIKLLIAEYGTEPLASMYLAISGSRGVFLYGASSSSHRNMMPMYALQWEAIRLCKMNKCKTYDMFGIAPSAIPSHPLYGLYKFKTGFGGKQYHQLGTWDYPLDEDNYRVFRNHELRSQGFHLR